MRNRIFFVLWIGIINAANPVSGQTPLSLSKAIDMAYKNNLEISTYDKAIEYQSALIDAQVPVDKTNFFYEYDKNNIAENGNPIHVLGMGQNFKWPSLYDAHKKAQQSKVAIQHSLLDLQKRKLAFQIEKIYEDYHYNVAKQSYLNNLDSIYNNYLFKANRNLELGAGTIMETLTARQKVEVLRLELSLVTSQLLESQIELKNLLQVETDFTPVTGIYDLMDRKNVLVDSSIMINIGINQVESSLLDAEARYQNRLPEINVSLFGGINSFSDMVLYPGVQVGFSMALSKGYYKARKNADRIQTEIYQTQLEDVRLKLQNKKFKLEQKLVNIQANIELYKTLEATADQLIASSQKAMEGGEIDYFQYLITLDEALQTKMKNIELIHQYNQTILEYNYLLND